MSASRERKQRLAGDEVLAAKQEKAAQDATKAKRKTVVYIVIGIVCAILAAALLIWNSGFFQSRATAYTVDGVNYTAAEYTYFYRTAYNQYASYGMVSTSTPLDEQVYNQETGETFDDYFKTYAEESLKSLTLLSREAASEGMTLSDDEKAEIEDTIKSYKTSAAQYGYTLSTYLKANFGPYMTEGKLRDLLEMQTLAGNFYNEKLAGFTYEQDELNAYYDENAGTLDTFVHNTCFISSSTDYFDTEDADEAKAQAKDLADQMAAGLKDGGDFQALAEQYTKDQDNPTIYTNLTVPGSQLSSLYGDWLRDTARKSGDVTVMESSSGTGYFVVQFLDRYLLTDGTADIRHILIKAETDEGADAPTAEQMAAAKAKVEELLATWQSGEATEDSFAALANENSEDTGSNTNGGFYNAYRGQMIPNFDSWIFDPARQTGDTGIVENDNNGTEGYHLIYYVGSNTPYWQQQATSALQDADMGEWLDGLMETLQTSSGSGMKYVG